MGKATAIKLTAKAVQSAKADPSKRVELWDALCPGLCLRITQQGAKSWVVRYRTIDGRQPRMSLGPAGSGEGDLQKARDKATEIRRIARDGGDPAAAKRAEAVEARAQTIRTMQDLADEYFRLTREGKYRATKRGKKPATIEAEERLWNFRLKTDLGKRQIEAVKRADVRGLLEGIADTAPIQSNRALALLRSIFNFAVTRERLAVNPIARLEAIGEETARERILTDVEIKAVWQGLENTAGLRIQKAGKPVPVHVSPAVSLALRLSILTLQRRGEVAGMRKDELRLEEATWLIGGDRMKNGRPHLVPLSPDAVTLIGQALALQEDDSSPFVFPSPWRKLSGKSIDGGALSHALSDVYSALKIVGANLHDLRRTGASAMASERLKVAPVVISRVLAHTLDAAGGAAVTARHYALYDYATEKRSALSAWANLLGVVVRGRAANVTPLRA